MTARRALPPPRPSRRILLPCLVLILSTLSLAGAALGQCTTATPIAKPAGFTYTAVASGDWNNPATWGAASTPGNGAIVCIPSGRQVLVKTQETSRLRFIQVDGELRPWIHSNTRLYVDTLVVTAGGSFNIGSTGFPVLSGVTAEIVFISWNGSSIDRTWDLEEKSRGLIAAGPVHLYGETKTHMVALTADVPRGATSLTLDSAPAKWQVADSSHAGDKIVLTGSYFQEVSAATSSQDEQLTLTGISGSTISFTPALSYDHVRARSDLGFHLHVANLTRNVVLRSESASIPLRGHVMLLHNDVDIRGVAFVDLGRTDKSVALDDMVVTLFTDAPSTTPTDYSIDPRPAGQVTNRRGRYALHFHKNGTPPSPATTPAKVWNSVVNRTVGWGFVSHSRNVDFQDDVAYDFRGAGFVTESGDELGSFTRDIAIRGTGDGRYRPDRIVFQNPKRPQPLADFAFSGDGFWFQGPAVRAKDNVASGCDGAGMIWFTTGAPDVEQRYDSGAGRFHDRYTGFQRGTATTVYAGNAGIGSFLPRYWDHSTTNELLVTSDLPILECDGFEGYGNLVGFRLRFNNHDSVFWYGESPFDFRTHIVKVGADDQYAIRMRESVKNLKLWNNERGFSIRYGSRSDWQTVTNVNRLSYDALPSDGTTGPYDGAEIKFAILSTSFTGLISDGYEVAAWIEDDTTAVRNQITFPVQPTYSNYANKDTWNQSAPLCATPTVLGVANTGVTSRRIDVMANSSHGRYLVRFRAAGDPQWRFATSTTFSINLTGLSTSKTYTYQVIAGCKDPATGKETRPSSYTTAATFTT